MKIWKAKHTKGVSAVAVLGTVVGLGLSALKTVLSMDESLMSVSYSKEDYHRRRNMPMEQTKTNVIALPPPKVSEILKKITENKPINATGLVTPQLIELQALNVVEISLGRVYSLPYVIIRNDGDNQLGLYNPTSNVVLKYFPVGSTIRELNDSLRHGRIVCWYSTLGDFVNKRNRVPLELGGVKDVSH
jgi:hypothetical protein